MIIVKANLFVNFFLDIHFNLLNGTFKPYRNLKIYPVYVHKYSNHTVEVLKEPPKIIGKQISTILPSKEIFEKSKVEYEDTLKTSGYNEGLVFENSSVDENDLNK